MSGIKIKTHMSTPIDAGEISIQPVSQQTQYQAHRARQPGKQSGAAFHLRQVIVIEFVAHKEPYS